MSRPAELFKRLLLNRKTPLKERPEINPLDFLRKQQSLKDISRNILESSNQLIIKREKTTGKAAQEFEACRLARFLLPKDLSPPNSWGHFEGTFFAEKCEGTLLSPSDREHIGLAVDFLVKLHSLELSEEILKALISQGFDHYFGKTLKMRLRQEVEMSQLAFRETKSLGSLIKEVKEGVAWIMENFALDVDPVLGHGDFRVGNLLIIHGRLQPVDWVDFGICERAYEIVHLTAKLDDKERMPAFDKYYERVKATESSSDLLKKGMAIDAVVRIGACAREVCNGVTNAADNTTQSRFRRCVQRLLHARSLA